MCSTRAPRRASPLRTAPTATSFPGMGWELNITVSRSPISIHLLLPSAIWVNAARVSPWEPVHTISTRAGSSSSISVMSLRA